MSQINIIFPDVMQALTQAAGEVLSSTAPTEPASLVFNQCCELCNTF